MKETYMVHNKKREGVTPSELIEFFKKLPPDSCILLDDFPVSKVKARVRGVSVKLDLYM